MINKYTFLISFVFIVLNTSYTFSQCIYKTPSGEKYHLSTCTVVKNVSTQVVELNDIQKYQLLPCKRCNPPGLSQIKNSNNPCTKAVGQNIAVRCKGITKKGTQCKHFTRMANGYCFQHTKQSR